MTAEIIAVGTELLLGDIVNTNAQYLARRLAGFGVNVYRQTVVGDNRERLKAALGHAFQTADLVITTGGLGPTEDDLTKEAAADYFGRKLTLHEPSLAAMQTYFNGMGRDMPASNKKQAYFPEGAAILPNPLGTAPGCMIEADGKTLIILPGPPFEMTAMFDAAAAPYLSQRQNAAFYARELRMAGIGESAAEEKIRDIIDATANPTIGTYASQSELRFRVMAKAATEAEAKALTDPVAAKLYERLGKYIYGEGGATLESVVLETLRAQRRTLAVAESCTGGLLAGRLVGVPGCSDVFLEGAVTYRNQAKIARLGVQRATLDKHGAVSEQTAVEMAEGIRRTAGADVGVSTTGIAGPDGGTAEKPVGLVYIAVSANGQTTCQRHVFRGDRAVVRQRAVTTALNILRLRITP